MDDLFDLGEVAFDLTVIARGKGEPAGAGSKTADVVMKGKKGEKRKIVYKDGRPLLRYRPASKFTKPWMDYVKKCAAEVWGDREPLRGAVWLDLECYEPHVDTHFRSGRFGHLFHPSAPAYPHSTTTPDSGKLRRAIEDSLTGIVWGDDKQVVAGRDRKFYIRPGEGKARAVIRVGLMPEQTVVDLGLPTEENVSPDQEQLLPA